MIHIHTTIEVGKDLNIREQLECPHCNQFSIHKIYELISTFSAIPLPKSKVYICDNCANSSVKEQRWMRIVNFVFILPLFLIALTTFCFGVLAIPLSYYNDSLDGFTYLLAIGLTLPTWFLLKRMFRFIKMNFSRNSLLPMSKRLSTEV
jgi:hypothetical protein